jgi:histidinol dehydrogenase
MRPVRVEWTSARQVAEEVLAASLDEAPSVEVEPIRRAVEQRGDAALIELTNRFDATDTGIRSVVVEGVEAEAAADSLESGLKEAILLAIENVRAVAEAQVNVGEKTVEMPQGHTVIVGEVPVGAAAIYAPGGRKSYPSSVVMGAVTARAAGVERVALASPPGPDGKVDPVTLAAASLCGVDEVYAVGGAQAIYALALGTESIQTVDVIVGPGNTWVQEAKKDVFGEVGIDSPAGPSDITVVFGPEADVEPLALDLCAQAEHGVESPLTAIAVGGADLGALIEEVDRIAAGQSTVNDCLLFLVEAPSNRECLELIQLTAPEHLELVGAEAESLAPEVTTAGCVFVGPFSATAFGDYVAGSNHVLPTGGAGRTFGPLAPSAFRRSTSRVILDEGSASDLAGAVEALSEAEGLPVHGLSARARAPR